MIWWAVLVALLIAALVIAAVFSAALLMADRLTSTRRRRVRGTPGGAGLRAEEIQFLSADDVILRGWFVASPGARAAVILVHGAGEHRSSQRHGFQDLLADYVVRVFSVFTFDLEDMANPPARGPRSANVRCGTSKRLCAVFVDRSALRPSCCMASAPARLTRSWPRSAAARCVRSSPIRRSARSDSTWRRRGRHLRRGCCRSRSAWRRAGSTQMSVRSRHIAPAGTSTFQC